MGTFFTRGLATGWPPVLGQPHAAVQHSPTHRCPSDLQGSVTSQVAEAIRNGTARLVGFESQGHALSLLAAREATRAQQGSDTRTSFRTVEVTTRKWTSLADVMDVEVQAVGAGLSGWGRRA